MHGFTLMLREGGWGAYAALFVGIIGLMVGVTALVTLMFSRRTAAWIGIASMVLAIVASAVGVLGMQSGRHRTEEAVGMIESSAMAERILKMGYLEAQNAAKIGFGAALAPLVLGLVAALVGATGNRRAVAGGVAALAIVPIAGALVASQKAPPKGKYDFDLLDDAKWNLVAARERVDVMPAMGCRDWEKALRELGGDPTPIVPDWRDAATKCAQLNAADTKPPDAQPVGQTDPAISGDLAAEVVRRVVRSRQREMRACYEKGLASNAALAGRVTTRFVIGETGKVLSVADAGSDLPDASVAECIRGVFKRLVFPAPGRGTVTVTYPIVFTSAGQ